MPPDPAPGRHANVTGAEPDTLIPDNPFYLTAGIPGGICRGSGEDTQTFGTGTTCQVRA